MGADSKTHGFDKLAALRHHAAVNCFELLCSKRATQTWRIAVRLTPHEFPSKSAASACEYWNEVWVLLSNLLGHQLAGRKSIDSGE
jgi:hypothetical protein